jgi:hypothetical protein
MTKKLVIVAALMTFCGSVFAQDGSDEENASEGGGFLSGIALKTNNKFQVSLMLGNANLFNQDLSYVLPKYSDNTDNVYNREIGIGGSWTADKSEDPGQYIYLNNLGEGNLLNMAGLSFAYYITDGLDVNLSFGMDLRSTPKKNYEENVKAGGLMIQGAKWIEGRVQNNWILSAGSNYHFKVTNEKIDFYGGIKVGYQHGQLTFTTPYTRAEYDYFTNLKDSDVPGYGNLNPDNDPSYQVKDGEIPSVEENPYVSIDPVVSNPRSGAGQINCITASILAGVSYNLGGGLSLGLEFEPYAYRYSMLEVCPKGARVYQAATYANRFFASPMLKLGFRF